ncbi:MAG: AI-2 transport protein TqsA, partial [Paracoccaceae bacterium]
MPHPAPDPAPKTGPVALAAWRDVLLIGTLTVFSLYAGAGFLIPLTLAILVFVLISALSDRVRNQTGAPVWLANLVGVAAVLSGLFVIMFILGNQATQFARAIPTYEAMFDSALTRIVAVIGNDVANALRDMLVKVDMGQIARSAFGGARSFLSTFFLICLYVAFMMA